MTDTDTESLEGAPEERLGARTRFRRALVVANPIAGRGQGESAAAEMTEGLRQLGVAAETFLTAERGDALRRLRCAEPDIDLVISVGGDGTFREVLAGLIDPEVPVGILPCGTANVLATDLALPRDIHAALEVVARGRIQALDVARVNGHLSFLVTGVGIDAMAVREVEERRRGPITRWTYVNAMRRALSAYDAPRLTVSIDGEELKGEFGLVLVGNTTNYGGVFHMAADAVLDDGLWEVYLFPGASRRRLLRWALRGFFRRLPGGGCEMRRGRRVEVRAESPVPVQVDGDLRGETPVELEVGDVQYRVLVP
jgi:diacylglycerol kinase (ATP)